MVAVMAEMETGLMEALAIHHAVVVVVLVVILVMVEMVVELLHQHNLE
jgi:hypothetical protein